MASRVPAVPANVQRGAQRFFLPILAGVVLLLAGVLLIGTGIAGARSNVEPVKSEHTVVAGETLWSIARSVKPHGDVRPLVSKIARLNHVGQVLEPGMSLVLP
jgi:nucleoid-associated protein YgaU